MFYSGRENLMKFTMHLQAPATKLLAASQRS